MSIITEQVSAFEFDSELLGSDVEERNSHRLPGFFVAISASVLLWGGIGTGIWGLVSLFG